MEADEVISAMEKERTELSPNLNKKYQEIVLKQIVFLKAVTDFGSLTN